MRWELDRAPLSPSFIYYCHKCLSSVAWSAGAKACKHSSNCIATIHSSASTSWNSTRGEGENFHACFSLPG